MPRILRGASITLATILLPLFLFAQPRGGNRPPGGGQGGPGGDRGPKNLQVLKDIDGTLLNPVMDFFTASLGVKCNHCHVSDSTGFHPERDDKGPKKTAREMIQMVMDVNAKNFSGRPAVTCYTCHRGGTDPENMPKLPVVAAADRKEESEEEDATIPKVPAILASYEKALGGADAMAKVKTRSAKGVVVRREGDMPTEYKQEAPNKMWTSTEIKGRGSLVHVYDGTSAWVVFGKDAQDLPKSEFMRMARDADMFPIQRLKGFGDQLHVRGKDTVNGHTAYVLMARIGDDLRERYYIDTATSLLLRRTILTKTPIAWIPNQLDYTDYRQVDGVMVPFETRSSYVNPRENTIRRMTAIEQNGTVDEKLFTKPETKSEKDK